MAKLRVDKIASVGVSTETTGSVFFDGPTDGNATATDSIIIPSSPDFNWGTGDFTVETWVYGTDWTGGASNQDQVIYYHNEESAGFFVRAGALHYYNGGFVVSGPTLEDARWYHLAAARQSGTLTLYVDGVSQGSASHTDDYGEGGITIGKNSGNSKNQFRGYLSNFRICKGHAVYKSNFTVPNRELDVHPGPDDDRTVFLGFYDGENIFADKTGRHIIAAYGDRTSSPTPTATDSPIGITTFQPGLTRDVDNTFGPVFQGGAGYASQNWLTLPKGITTERSPDFVGVDAASARGLFISGGVSPGTTGVNTIDFITIATTGDAQDFGDLTTVARRAAGCSSSTRGLAAGGYRAPAYANTIDYVTISSTGNGQDFGDLLGAQWARGSCSNSTRGIWAGGYSNVSPFNIRTIEYVTIQSQGNSIRFGELSTTTGLRELGAAASTTRGLFAGGRTTTPSTVDKNIIEYVTISSTGNPVDFGDLSAARTTVSGASSSTRAVFFGGFENPGAVNTIEFVTIASLGDATNFGDLTLSRYLIGSTSSKIRATSGGGTGVTNVIDYVTIASAGNAQNFGDLTAARQELAAVSNGHGGLG